LIPDSFIQDLLARVDIADVVGRYVQLRKGGANLLGLCPFHNEKSPSFTVSPAKQFYHCFGCGAHGSAIGFLMEHTGASYPDAIRSLAASIGMAVPEEPRGPRQQAETARRKAEVSRHAQALDKAQAHYLRQLRGSPQAIAYLKQRGLTGEIAARFGLGWSGTDRNGLSKAFDDYADPMLADAGLVIESDDGRRYDRFRERIMFPIRNARGVLVGFGGRVIGKGEPKYLNSPETPVFSEGPKIFSKGQELYGLWEARQAIRQEDAVIVVEGYMDVVGLAQLGIANAVATLGTATTPDHIKKLLRASDKVAFSFDGDKAGRNAAWKALLACLPELRDGAQIRFLFLPPEHDPDSYVRERGADAFRALLNEAPSLSRFLLDELAARHRLDEAEGRAACLREAAPLIAAMPACALRTQIERELARQVQLTPEEMSQALAAQARPRGPLPGPAAGAGAARAAFAPGDDSAPDFPVSGADGEPLGSPGPGSGRPDGRRGGAPAGRAAAPLGQTAGRRAAPSRARRLLCLLLTHPELVDGMGDQQLEVIGHDPQLDLVRELIALAQASGARHLGALLEAAGHESDLGIAIQGLRGEVLTLESLPEPQAEWDDALRRLEIDAIRDEMNSLARDGLQSGEARRHYGELTARLDVLKRERR
jgi:DNA primase